MELWILEENTVLKGKVHYLTAWMKWNSVALGGSFNTCCSLPVMTQFYL